MKKNKSLELDVDFIGGEGPLTKEEEKIISDFIKKRKSMNERKLKNNSGKPLRTKAS